MQDANAISEADFVLAYRLLLNRDPEPAAVATIRNELKRRRIARAELVASIVRSPEFRRLGSSVSPEHLIHERLVLNKQDGFDIYIREVDHDISEVIRSAKGYEPHVVAAFRQLATPGSTVLDVGANIGFFSLLAAHLVGPTGRVIAVEPMDKNLQLLQKSALHNRFGQIEVLPFAASDATGVVAMQSHLNTTNAEAKRDLTAVSDAIYAPARALDSLLADQKSLALLKIDIEGFEPFAWRGLKQTLARLRPAVISEFHPQAIERNAQSAPEDYAAELVQYAGGVTVLARGGRRIRCSTAAEVMNIWRAANAEARLNGVMHLDLLADPGGRS